MLNFILLTICVYLSYSLLKTGNFSKKFKQTSKEKLYFFIGTSFFAMLFGGWGFIILLLMFILIVILGYGLRKFSIMENYKFGFDNFNQQETEPSSNTMTRKEALEILDVDENSTNDEIKQAYINLMTLIHPDKGGSKYLAAKVNQARDLLIGKK